jgi:hypothetical protein
MSGDTPWSCQDDYSNRSQQAQGACPARSLGQARRPGFRRADAPRGDLVDAGEAAPVRLLRREEPRGDLRLYGHPSIFIGGVETTFGEVTAEGDRVAIEAETRGTLPDGRVYTNMYHYLFTFRDGLVWRVKEYLDTQSAAEFFAK